MKRLIDENIDASARQLLEAGCDVHPDPAKKAAFQAAISMGGVGLLTGTPKAAGLGLKGAAWTAKLSKLGVLIAVGSIGTVILMRQRPPKATAPTAAVTVILASESVPLTPAPLPTVGGELSREPKTADVPSVVHSAPRAELPVRRAPERASPRSKEPSMPSLLRQEADLVDALRHAVQAKDRHQSALLSARYWRDFGSGQLVPEVRHLDAQWRDER
jgi:hypothetical protein